ncbi:MAG: Tex family protein [Gammaproteobacteria bacterium]
MMVSIARRLAEELGVRESQVNAAVDLLDGGATVPFIARYRKEATGALDDTQLRLLEERLGYLRELEERRAAILKSIAEQDKLTPALEADIKAADTKTRLEDLYRPYMPKRRTKAQIAREAGLEPLAMGLLEDPQLDPHGESERYVDADKGVPDGAAALDGARQILMELFAEDAELVGELREYAWDHGRLQSTVVTGKEQEGAKFADYFAAMEPIKSIPSHRALAMFRGQSEGVLSLKLLIDEVDDAGEPRPGPSVAETLIARRFGLRSAGRPADSWLADTARWAWRVKLSLHLELEMKKRLREGAEAEAIQVFAHNLKDLLLAAPAGPRATMGLDPGIRTGVKVAVVDGTGKLVDTATIYPHAPKKQWDQSIATLAGLARKHRVELVSIGNGTASRETDRLVADLIKRHPDLDLTKVMVSEAGASVYSASETAAREFPDLDVSLRGAASIARRLQDPLAELVKIEPKSIGVGQYQHDVGQARLARSLDNVVEDCVNAVGVDVNTASVPLLARVSGLGPGLAENIVAHRNEHGPFRDRRQFTAVQRLGPKAFEQAAGFLRIMNGDNPLDASSVHPEAYPVVERILAASARDIVQLIGDSRYLRGLSANDFTDDTFGTPTVRDILAELEKPGRDPRPEFRTAAFRDGVERMEDLKPGMRLEGVVTNVANFGAFVDIGVHQDGLVHISALADRFVSDPRTVVKAGDIVTVTVLDVDLKRKRSALSMRKDGAAPAGEGRAAPAPARERSRKPRRERPASPPANTAMADALAKLRR